MTRNARRVVGPLVLSLLTGALAGASPAIGAPPANDNFASATTLPSDTSAAITGTNDMATTQAGEPLCCFTTSTVWYRWTAPKTGNYRIELCGSNFNSYLNVLRGTAVNALQQVAVNDNDPGCGPDGSRSRLILSAIAGQRYEIQVGSSGAAGTGTIAGSIAPIPVVPAPVVPIVPTPKPRVVALFALDSLSARSGKSLRIRFAASEAGAATVEIRKGRRSLVRLNKTLRSAVPSSVRFRGKIRGKKLKPGRYTVVLTVTTSDGRKATDTVRLRIRRSVATR